MTGQMTVVAVRHTGHVLGAITSAAPSADPDVATVAGDAMPVRLGTAITLMPAARLAVAALGFDPRVFANPRDARVIFPGQSDQDPSLAFLISTDHGEVTNLNADTLQVKSTAAALNTATSFLVLFQPPSGQPPVIVTGEIAAKETTSAEVAHALQSGTTYDALVLLAGFAAHHQTSNVP